MKLRTLALAGVVLIGLAAPASAGSGLYLDLGAGWSHLGDVKYQFPPAAPAGVVHFNDATRYLGGFGYKWDDGLRLEFEAAYSSFHATGFTPNGGALNNFGGRLQTSTFMLNGLYDLPLTEDLAFTVGGGAGVAYTDTKTRDAIEANVGKGAQFAWQGIAGLTWAATPWLDLQVDYRYGKSGKTRNDYQNPIGTFSSDQLYGRKRLQAAMFTMRFYLESEAAPPPPAPLPPPPPAPLPPPPVKTFIVFFDFDKSNLTAEAQAVVTEAVSAAKTNGWVKVMVTGHTDTVGSDGYNQALSERRADAVKDEMVRQGMATDAITTQGKSFHDPLVPTGPGVREPQNRRAVIEY